MRLQPPRLDDPLDAIASHSVGGSAASIDAWLNVVSRLMHLPEATRREICSELREHLRERVRDLLLSGSDERDAIRQAIDELGETAQLARRFEAANRPHRRRFLMQAMLTLLGAGAIAAGALTLSHNNSARTLDAARFDAQSAAAVAPPKVLADARVSLAADATMRQALETVLVQTKIGLMVNWGQLESNGIQVDQPMGVSFSEMPGPRALTLIAQATGARENYLDWRARENNLIEFGLRSELDRREIDLVTYDITDSLGVITDHFADTLQDATKQVTDLLTSMVEPENWVDNGGDLAQMKLVGGRLFVQAPSRMHGKVKWILDQLPRDAENPVALNAVRNAVRRVLNPGDTVTLSIYELYQPNTWQMTTRQIDEVGMYRVPELGDVRAAGMTKDQFMAIVAAQLKEKVMSVEPKVDVVLENAAVARECALRILHCPCDVRAAGLTIDQFEAEVVRQLKAKVNVEGDGLKVDDSLGLGKDLGE